MDCCIQCDELAARVADLELRLAACQTERDAALYQMRENALWVP